MSRNRRKIHKTPDQVQPELAGGTVTIERLAHGGYGVGYLNGLAVFLPRTTPGDVGDVCNTEASRRDGFGENRAKSPACAWACCGPLSTVRSLWWLSLAAPALRGPTDV